MQRSIGLAILVLFTALVSAPLARAGENSWWYGGEIADSGYFYAQEVSIERLGDEAVINGLLIFPEETEGVYGFEGHVYCSEQRGFYIHMYFQVDGEEQTDDFLHMKPSEAAIATAMACSNVSDWPALGYKIVDQPGIDALTRYKAAQ
jgi:hypothetical protein